MIGRLSFTEARRIGLTKRKRPHGPLKQTEQQFHRAVAQYLDMTFKGWWTTIGHGGGGLMRGKILKGLGVKAGVPDLMLIKNGRTLFIELKTEDGRLSEAQARCHMAIEKEGPRVVTCRSITEIAREIDIYFPLFMEAV